ncbi:class D sortase [Metabacillus sp. JX24]|uniref:class D sortase n=1 Tax=Metabacillus sp. JX24 TaxID=3240759 RepID=UPI0035107206
MKKQNLFLLVSVLLISSGIWLMTTNSATIAKGYFIYKISSEPKAETIQKNNEEKQTAAAENLLYPKRPAKGERIGDLYIPKLEANLPIYHGTAEEELEQGVGHYAGSVLPGEKDNSVLSGHRDTVFRKLGEVGKGDLLIVTTSAGEFTYAVRQVRIVDKDDRTVIVPKPKAVLTVSTCYPFTFAGPAPERYILIADLLASK